MVNCGKTSHLIVKGSVQGVGFRAMVKRHADKLTLNGSVKNLSNGYVEIYIQGDPASIETFILGLKESKGLAKIEHIEVDDYSGSKQFSSFEIIF